MSSLAGYNAKMKRKNRAAIWLLLMFTLTSCASGEFHLPTIVPLPSRAPLTSPTPSPVLPPTHTLAPSLTSLPTATQTPEPITYAVTDKDDMFGVALRFGVSLEALKTANPSVIPNLMGVGTVLNIPITPTPAAIGASQGSPTQTPDPFSPLRLVGVPVCYADAFGGAYCFAQLENISQNPVENPSARFTLASANSAPLEMDGILPLNILPAGEILPLVAYFLAPLPVGFEVRAKVQDWLPVMPDDNRYLSVKLTAEPFTPAPNTHFAEARGEVSLSSGEADYLWVLGVIYDQDGQVLGVRRWEAAAPLSAGSSIPFSFNIYSMQGEIKTLKLFVEAHSKTP